jgi:hypothetical protein
MKKVIFGFSSQFIGTVEKEVEVSDYSIRYLVKKFKEEMGIEFDTNCYIHDTITNVRLF